MNRRREYLNNMPSDKIAKDILSYQMDKMEAENRERENHRRQRATYGTSPIQMQKGNKDRLSGLSLEKKDRYDIKEIRTEGELIQFFLVNLGDYFINTSKNPEKQEKKFEYDSCVKSKNLKNIISYYYKVKKW